MKKYNLLAPLISLLAVSFAFVGFQCSSAELTSAKLYMQKSEWNKAESELEKAVKKDSLDEESWYYLGIVRGEKKDYAGLMDAFAHAQKISAAHDSDIVQVRLHYWVIAYNDGSKDLQKGRDSSVYYQDALKLFKGTVLLEPDSTMGYRGLAYTYLNMGNEDSAVAPLEVLWNRDKDENAAKLLGEIYYEKGRNLKLKFEEANGEKIKIANGLAALKTGISKYDVTSDIGKPDEKTTEPAHKVKQGRKMVEIPVKDVWTYKKLGLTITFQADTVAEKKVDFVYSPNIDSTDYKLAFADFQKGLAVLKPASEMYPNDASVMTVLTNCYIGADMTQQAADAFKLAAQKNPDNKDFQYNYGVILLRANKYPQAISEFEKTLKIDPEYWNAVYNMGASYVNWGVEVQDNASQNSDPDSLRKAVSAKFEKALPYLEKFSNYKPSDPSIWDLLGKVYANLNEVQKAQDAMQRADSLRNVH